MKSTESSDKLGLKELIAMGIGGMVGGGIFSVLGLSVASSGHAAPIAFTIDRKSTRLNSSHTDISRMPSSA